MSYHLDRERSSFPPCDSASSVVGFLTVPLLLIAALLTSAGAQEAHRCALWIDLMDGEPISYEEMLKDLSDSRVIYLGERHSVQRHHEVQTRIVTDLGRRGVKLALGLEQMESVHQAALDRYSRGEISFEQLAEATQWDKRWRGYEEYKRVLEAAHAAHAPILALNAPLEVIRQVARGGGVAKLDPATRKALPAEMTLDDPPYETLLNLQMMVHVSAMREKLRPMIEAQIARDDAMAAALAKFLQSDAGHDRTVVVLCGSGHAAYGLGTPSRVRRRMPGIKDRIVLLSESGDVELSPEEKAMARPIAITHEQLRQIGRPIADYLQATAPK